MSQSCGCGLITAMAMDRKLRSKRADVPGQIPLRIGRLSNLMGA
jgi:hypothetical protein